MTENKNVNDVLRLAFLENSSLASLASLAKVPIGITLRIIVAFYHVGRSFIIIFVPIKQQ